MEFLKRFKNLILTNQTLPVPEFPQNIILEPTNACNLRCRMCPVYGEGVKKSREVGFIKEETYRQIIDEIGSWPTLVNLDIHGAGEPLLYPGFLDILSHAKSKENIIVGFLCNATLLTPDKSEAIVGLGVDWICFSVDGAEKDIFEFYRKGSVYDSIEKNISHLISLKKNNGKPNISFNMVAHEEADLNVFIDRWTGLVDSLQISLKRPVLRENNTRLRLLKPCPLIYQQLVIGWPGKTGLCCEDLWGDYITGDFPSESLYDIWHGKLFTKARRLHENCRQDKLYLCSTCDTPYFHKYEEKTIEKYGRKTLIRKELDLINSEFAKPRDILSDQSA